MRHPGPPSCTRATSSRQVLAPACVQSGASQPGCCQQSLLSDSGGTPALRLWDSLPKVTSAWSAPLSHGTAWLFLLQPGHHWAQGSGPGGPLPRHSPYLRSPLPALLTYLKMGPLHATLMSLMPQEEPDPQTQSSFRMDTWLVSGPEEGGEPLPTNLRTVLENGE